jgi:two-component system, OmpR family, sensor histidine kinase KdpD
MLSLLSQILARAQPSAFAHKVSIWICAAQHKDCVKTLDKYVQAAPDSGMKTTNHIELKAPKTSGSRFPLLPYAASLLFVAAVALFGIASTSWLPATGLPLLFLMAVLGSAVTFGFWPGITSAAIAFGTYNFMFVEPLYTLRVSSAADVLALSLFLFTAGLTGWLAGRARDEAHAANRRAAHLGELSHLTSALGDSHQAQVVFDTLIRHITLVTQAEAVVVQKRENVMIKVAALPPDTQLDDFSMQACERAFRYSSGQPATAAGWEGSRFGFYPLIVEAIVEAVIGVRFPGVDRIRVSEIEQTVKTMIAQAAAALSRIRQTEMVEVARIRADQEGLRSTLLLSLSHDLRTPLATILGSVSSLRQLGASLPQEARDDLLIATEEETRRLSRYVEDLLTMTRLNTGLQPRLEWVDPADIVNSAVERARNAHPKREMLALIQTKVALVHSDAALLEQALFNLLDNAAKFSPPETIVRLVLSQDSQHLSFIVEDQGAGIAKDQQQHVFDPLFRGSDLSVKGTGLGLAIVRGIATLLGGTVSLQSPLVALGGTRFSLILPSENSAPK